jgi:hypothetical protein
MVALNGEVPGVALLDDVRLRESMRAFLDASDALATSARAAETDEASAELIEAADAKTLAEMILAQQLERVGWTSPRAVARTQPTD